MKNTKKIILSVLMLAGLHAGYADNAIYTIPQGIACFTQYGESAEDLSYEVTGINLVKNDVSFFINALGIIGGYDHFIGRLSEIEVLLSNRKANILNNTVCDKTWFIKHTTDGITIGEKTLSLLKDMKSAFESSQKSLMKAKLVEAFDIYINVLEAELPKGKQLLEKAKAL